MMRIQGEYGSLPTLAEIVVELLDVADAWIGDLSPGNLGQRANRHAGLARYARPLSLDGLQVGQYLLVDGPLHNVLIGPNLGRVKPALGPIPRLASKSMKGKKKQQKPDSIYRAVLARNVKALMEFHFAESSNKPLAVARATGTGGLSKSTVQRILAGTIGVNLETLDLIATALNVLPYQLLLPRLDARNPQVVKGATEEERKLYSDYERGRRTGQYQALQDFISKGTL